MKQLITFEKKCVLCNNLKTYTLRDTNVDQMDDKEARVVILNMMKRAFEFGWCEKCQKFTRQEIVAFDY